MQVNVIFPRDGALRVDDVHTIFKYPGKTLHGVALEFTMEKDNIIHS